MVMRLGGLASGMDIDALVEKLMKAEKAPLNKLLQNKTRYEWQRDAYRDVNKKLKTFDTYIADNLVLKTLNAKTASSSNSDLVSATATGKASGTLTIEGVSQLATAARSTSGQIYADKSTKMSTLLDGASKISLQAPGAKEATIIEVPSNMSVEDFVKKVNDSNAGVTAIFENNKFSFTAKDTGAGKIDIKGLDDNGGSVALNKLGLQATEGKNAIFTVNGIATERATNSFSLNGYNVTLKKTFNEGAVSSDFINIANQNLATANQNLNDTFNTIATKYGLTLTQSNNNDKYNYLAAELAPKLADAQTATSNALTALTDARKGSSSAVKNLSQDTQDFIASLSKEQRTALANKDLDQDDLTDLNFSTEQEAAFQALSSSDKTALNAITEQQINYTSGAAYDALSKDTKALLNSKSLTDLKADPSLKQEEKDLLDSLSDDDYTALQNLHTKVGELETASENLAEISSYTNDLNNKKQAFDDAQQAVNQLPPSTPTTNPASTVTLNATTNVDDMMKKIKDFVETYNGLVKDLNAQTKETKYRDYTPLTEEQKKDMKENEIKLWEEKARSGLLRNDSLIREGLSNMRSLIYEVNPGLEDSKFNSLFNIGITSSRNYNEGGTLEIDEDKLRKALEEDPDAVERLFKNADGKKEAVVDGKTVDTRGFVDKLRDSLKTFEVSIEKKAGRATMTDAQYSIGKTLQDTEKRISTWQDKLKNIEARYWKQFTAMEQAINKANQQSGMFFPGMGQQ